MAEDAGSIYAEVRIRLANLDNDVKQATARLDSLEKTAIEGTGKASKQASANLAAIGVAAVAMSTVVIKSFRALITSSASYSEALSGVQAATRGSAAELDALAVAAEGAGKQVAASSAESLGAIEALSKAGVSTADIMGGALPGALTLAAAGEMEVADAAEIAAATMTQFGLAGADVVHIADLLAAGAGKAQGEVSDLSQALKQAGLVASQTGLSVDDTVGSLAAFASAGLLGSDAGTSFRTMLLRLTPQSKEAADEMKRLGLNAFDSKGEFIGITKFAGQLKDQLSGPTTEQRNSSLATICGSDSIRAANVLYNQGAEGIASWIEKVNDQGFAAEVARIKLDNLAGDLKKLDAQIATTSAKIGGSLDPTLRKAAQGATSFLDVLDEINPGLAAFIVASGGVGAVIASITLGVGFLAPALAALGVTVTAAFGPIALAVGIAASLTAGIIALGNAAEKAKLDEVGKRFGDIATSAGMTGEKMAKFAETASKVEERLSYLSGRGIKLSGEGFEKLAKSAGLTNDELAQIALRSDKVGESVKNTARGYLDGARAAKSFAEANMALALTLRDAWRTATPAEVKKVEDALKNIPTTVEEVNEFTAAELDEFANRYRATAAKVADIVGYMRADREKEAIAGAEYIAETNQTIIDSYAYSQNRIRDIIEARMHGITRVNEEETQKQNEENVKLANSILTTFSGLASALGDIFEGIYQRQIDEATKAYDAERELIENNGMTRKEALEKNRDDAIATGDAVKIADAQRALDLYNLEAEYTKKKAQLEYDAAMVAWRLQIALATAQAAQAVLNAYSSGVATPIIGPATGAIFAGLASAVGALQIGAIVASQPQPPAFATGGIVLPSGQGGKQVTVADKGGGELMFGTGALGQPLMQGFADLVASKVAGGSATIQVMLDGRMIAESTVNFVDNGIVKMRSLTR